MTTLQPCKFTFDDEAIYDGFAHGSTWNGFDNVAVSKATLDRLIAEAIDPESKEQFTEIEPMADDLYSLAWGFATQILHDDFADVLKILADNDGACLYWQMPDVARAELALAACAILSDGDLLVHPDATVIEAGMAYTMKVQPTMNIFYASDGEQSGVMTLAALLSNFRENNVKHWPDDMRDDLAGRGWYEGSHDFGRYLVLNLDLLPLGYRDPAMDA